MKILFVYPRFARHAEANPELLAHVPMTEYLGSPSLGIASVAAATPSSWSIEYRDDRLAPADTPTDADLVALSFFTPAASRALQLADSFRAQGKTVVAGGIFPTLMPEVVAPHVDSIVVGEGEDAWPQLLADFEAGNRQAKSLRPRYQSGPIALAGRPQPRMDLYLNAETSTFRPDDYPLQISRGCPLACEACALPGTMGGSMRVYDLEHVLGQIDTLSRAGRRGCLTEDTSWLGASRSARRLGELFDALAARGQQAAISYAGISMPMILATTAGTMARARRAGVDLFYLVGGFDPITRRAFTGRDPAALARAEAAIAKCYDHGIEPYVSFLLGNDEDDAGTVDRMLDFARRSGIRKAEFAVFTPYPGTPSWHRLLAEGRILHRDWSKYNDANVVFSPRNFTPEGLHRAYLDLWRGYYADNPRADQLSGLERTIQF